MQNTIKEILQFILALILLTALIFCCIHVANKGNEALERQGKVSWQKNLA